MGNQGDMIKAASQAEDTAGKAINYFQQGDAAAAAGHFTASQYRFNEKLTGLAEKQNDFEANFNQRRALEKTAETVSGQKAAAAAQGMAVEGGTPETIRNQTSDVGAEDFLTLKNNARLKSLGYEITQMNDESNASSAEAKGNAEKNSDYFAGGMGILSGGLTTVEDLKL